MWFFRLVNSILYQFTSRVTGTLLWLDLVQNFSKVFKCRKYYHFICTILLLCYYKSRLDVATDRLSISILCLLLYSSRVLSNTYCILIQVHFLACDASFIADRLIFRKSDICKQWRALVFKILAPKIAYHQNHLNHLSLKKVIHHLL